MAVFTKRDIGGGVDLWPRDSVNITAQSPDNPLYHWRMGERWGWGGIKFMNWSKYCDCNIRDFFVGKRLVFGVVLETKHISVEFQALLRWSISEAYTAIGQMDSIN